MYIFNPLQYRKTKKMDMTLPSFIASLFAWPSALPASHNGGEGFCYGRVVCVGLHGALIRVFFCATAPVSVA